MLEVSLVRGCAGVQLLLELDYFQVQALGEGGLLGGQGLPALPGWLLENDLDQQGLLFLIELLKAGGLPVDGHFLLVEGGPELVDALLQVARHAGGRDLLRVDFRLEQLAGVLCRPFNIKIL